MVWRTLFITMSTCFLLGTTFTHWIADHNILWRSPITSEAVETAIKYYSLFSLAPPGLGWVYIGIGMIAIISAGGRLLKGLRGGGEFVFDGGSVVLLVGVTYTQITEVFPTINLVPAPLPPSLSDHPLYPGLLTAVRDLANDNVITAVMLTGVMFLQAGRYYATRPMKKSLEEDEIELNSGLSTPPNGLLGDDMRGGKHSPIADRASTPFRELTEEEALELRGSDDNSGPGR